MAVELSAELDAATADGAPSSSVLGHEPDRTLQEWGHARGLTGRSLHAGWLVPTGLLGFTAGTASLMVLLITGLGLPEGYAPVVPAIWASSAVLGVVLPTLACWGGLLSGGDPRAGATARWLLLTLTLGEVAAFFLAVGGVAALGAAVAVPLVGPAVLLVMAVALLVGRGLAVRTVGGPRSATDRESPVSDSQADAWSQTGWAR